MIHFIMQLLDNMKFADKWMWLRTIMLSKVTKIQKDEYHMFSLTYRLAFS